MLWTAVVNPGAGRRRGARAIARLGDALAALDRDPPQVVVSDIRMPGESGLELLQRAKALHAGLPVIIMTAYSDLESAVGAFQGGAYEYLPKPFDVDHALALIRRATTETPLAASPAAVPRTVTRTRASRGATRAAVRRERGGGERARARPGRRVAE